MDVNICHVGSVRSLVRPVSPLSSRWQKSVTQTTTSDKSDSKQIEQVHSTPPVGDFDLINSSESLSKEEETRRIIVNSSLQESNSFDSSDLLSKDSRPDNNSSSTSNYNNKGKYSYLPRGGGIRKRLGRRVIGNGQQPKRLPPSIGLSRTHTCPILVRLFYSTNARHYSLSDYKRGRLPENEIQLNTWIDATLRELADEVRFVCKMSRRRGTRLQFAIVYPDSRGSYGRRQLGVVITGYGSLEESPIIDGDNNSNDIKKGSNLTDDSEVTLLSRRFQIGDYIDCAIVEYVPGSFGGWSTGRRPLGPPHHSTDVHIKQSREDAA